MSWDDAHRYNQALRDVEEALDVIPDVEFAWRPEYREIFGSPEWLLLALRTRWQTTVHAQIGDAVVVDGRHSEEMLALAASRPALVRTLARAGAIHWVDEELRSLEVAA
jgi:hypothetical protein